MFLSSLKKLIKIYPDFPKEGVIFRDVLPVLADPKIYSQLISNMSSAHIFKEADAILSIDARGFLFGSAIALKLSKPMIVARKKGKIPGDLVTDSYNLEYGSNSLSIQKEALNENNKFVIVDDLLATGGTVECVSKILRSAGKEISGLSVVIELGELNGRSKLSFPVSSQITY